MSSELDSARACAGGARRPHAGQHAAVVPGPRRGCPHRRLRPLLPLQCAPFKVTASALKAAEIALSEIRNLLPTNQEQFHLRVLVVELWTELE